MQRPLQRSTVLSTSDSYLLALSVGLVWSISGLGAAAIMIQKEDASLHYIDSSIALCCQLLDIMEDLAWGRTAPSLGDTARHLEIVTTRPGLALYSQTNSRPVL